MRSDRQGIKAARFVLDQLARRGHEATLVDPLEIRLPLLDRMYKEHPKGAAPPELERLAQLYRAVDGFVIVSGEYNHGIPPALKNLLDHFLEEYFFRPSAIVCYSAGSFGGVRAAMQLRMTLAELGTVTILRCIRSRKCRKPSTTKDRPGTRVVEKRAQRFLDELEWFAKALQPHARPGTPY